MNVETWQLGEFSLGGHSRPLSDAISRIFGLCDCGYRLFDSNITASFTRVNLGPMTVVRYFGQGVHWAERRQDHVRHVAADDFIFYVPNDSIVTIKQRAHKSSFVAGHIGFVNTRDTFSGQIEPTGQGSFEMTGLVVPGALLRSRFPNIDDLAGQAINLGPSLFGVFSAYATAIDGWDAETDIMRVDALSNILFETLCSVSDYALVSNGDCSKAQTSARRALERIRTFALAHLTDPNLSVSLIANRLNMSPRYVHSAFEDSQWTVKSWIRHRRLLECRKAIRSPSMAGRTLTEIAFSWGFSDFSHFSRCYKEKFGCSPKHDRVFIDNASNSSVS